MKEHRHARATTTATTAYPISPICCPMSSHKNDETSRRNLRILIKGRDFSRTGWSGCRVFFLFFSSSLPPSESRISPNVANDSCTLQPLWKTQGKKSPPALGISAPRRRHNADAMTIVSIFVLTQLAHPIIICKKMDQRSGAKS